jgi:ribosome maturation factor RimP
VVPDEGDPVTGRITGTDDTGAVLDVEGAEHRVEYAAVKKAKIQIEFKKESR